MWQTQTNGSINRIVNVVAFDWKKEREILLLAETRVKNDRDPLTHSRWLRAAAIKSLPRVSYFLRIFANVRPAPLYISRLAESAQQRAGTSGAEPTGGYFVNITISLAPRSSLAFSLPPASGPREGEREREFREGEARARNCATLVFIAPTT